MPKSNEPYAAIQLALDLNGQLLATKLTPPRIPRQLVERPRLLRLLSEPADRKLTLLSAPPGFGKTTLLAEWLGSRDRPAVWLTLDEGDNDPAVFLGYLLAGLRQLDPKFGTSLRGLIGTPPLPPVPSLVKALLRDLMAAGSKLSLVLDDYHRIATPEVHETVRLLVEQLPPDADLVIATRADPPFPLGSLRASGQLVELRADDLRFTRAEAASFMQRAMGLGLTDAEIAALEQRTEGWIAGLQLAALSLSKASDRAAFLDSFTGSHRFVLDYLTEEVLRQQADRRRQFLLQTSILHRLCEPLCDAVLGSADSQEMLEDLERANLFLLPLDDHRRWYRYHHLFAEVLREQLRRTRPEVIRSLHRRAAHWFEHHGSPADAIRHALQGEDWERAADLVEAQAEPTFRRGEIATLQGWINALPESTVGSRPWLLIAHAWTLLVSGQLSPLEVRLNQAEAAVKPRLVDGDASARARAQLLAGHVATMRGELACSLGDFRQAVRHSRRAMKLLPEAETMVRGINALNIAMNMSEEDISPGEIRTAARELEQAAAVTARSGNLQARGYALGLLGALQRSMGQLHRAFATYQQGIEPIAERPAASPISAVAHVGLGEIQYEWNDLQAAREHLLRGVELAGQGEDLRPLAFGYAALARISEAEGDAASADDYIEEAKVLARHSGVSWIAAGVASAQVMLWLARGQLSEALAWAQGSDLQVGDAIGYRAEGRYTALARIWIADGQFERAIELLDWLAQVMQQGGLNGVLLEVWALKALALQARGQPEPALATLEQSLELAEPERYVRTFVDEGEAMADLLRHAASRGVADDYAARLLAAFPDELEAAQPLVEPLTNRELEVLHLVAAGMKNQAIAETLVITEGTVKGHLHRIFRKLDAANRVQAVAKAKRLRLLQS